ncbi:major capsid protein [Comamonas aquatica]|uniref:major capsid protein n=1 Tax=Comamonas aquatica TaxID=225991 RepID=UPI002447D02B|nr:major capsid protein [Comamonas aquatica]MDH0496300.1 major capsid protein [Comamonas aquatica]
MSKAIQARLAAIPAFVLATVGTAHAALPAGVSDAIDSAQTDMLAAIGLVIGAMVAVWGLLKLASKLGWR